MHAVLTGDFGLAETLGRPLLSPSTLASLTIRGTREKPATPGRIAPVMQGSTGKRGPDVMP